MVIAPIPVLDWKAVFRRRAKAARAKAAADRADAPQHAARHFMTAFAPQAPSAIALYHPKGDELDTWPLAEALITAGHHILLPACGARDAPLDFRRFDPAVPLVKGRFGIMEPGADAPVETPDVVIVPLLAVRPDGARLGYGGGHYDRTLEALRRADQPPSAIGFGYGAQQMDRFPIDDHDQFLDGFVSEQGAIRFSRRR
jgi:5-formyltetrahydrofolate cyclo-ligase